MGFPFDTLKIPDPEAFRSAASNLQSNSVLYDTYHQQLANGHANLMASWQGEGSEGYSTTFQQMQQSQQEHMDHLQQASTVHLGVATLLEAAKVAQDMALGMLAGAGIELAAGFFTGGITDALAGPEIAAAAETEAEAEAGATTARITLQNGFRVLVDAMEAWKDHKQLFQLGGAALGAGSGLVYSVEHHESLSQMALTVGNDALMGYDVGKNLSSGNPIQALRTAGGLLIGVEQYATSGDKANEDPFATIANWGLLTGGGGPKEPESQGNIQHFVDPSQIDRLENTENYKPGALYHIFNGTKKGGGYHYEGVPGLGGKIKQVTGAPDQHGVYEAEVEINGQSKGTNTFFPKSMSPQDVVNSINEAYKSRQLAPGKQYVWRGVTSSGMKIDMVLNNDGKITSAWPVYEP